MFKLHPDFLQQYLARNSRSKPVVSNDTSQGFVPFRSEKTPDAAGCTCWLNVKAVVH